MSDVKWIKIAVNIFDNRKIKQIEKLPEGDRIIAIWLKILCLAGTVNDSGMIYLTRDIPYTEQTLATEFNRPLEIIQVALGVFQRFGMIDIVNDFICVSNWEKYQNIDGLERVREQNRKRFARYYERKQLLESNVSSNVSITESNATDIEGDIDRDIDIDTKSTSAGKPRKTRKPFTPPTLDEVKAYISEHHYNVDAKKFYDYFTVSGWVDKKGDPVLNWKQKVITWSGRDQKGGKGERENRPATNTLQLDENGRLIT